MSERTTESPARILRTRAGALDHETYERQARELRREALGQMIGKAIGSIRTALSDVRARLKSARGRDIPCR